MDLEDLLKDLLPEEAEALIKQHNKRELPWKKSQ